MKHIPRKRFGQHFLTDRGIVEAIVRAIAPQPGQHMVEIGPGLAAMTQPLVERLGHLTVIELDRDLAGQLRARPGLTVVESDVLKVDFLALAASMAVSGGRSAGPSQATPAPAGGRESHEVGERGGNGSAGPPQARSAPAGGRESHEVDERGGNGSAEPPQARPAPTSSERGRDSPKAHAVGSVGAHKIRVVGNLPYNISTPILFHLLDAVDVIEDQHFMLQKEVIDRMVAAPSTAAYGRLSVMLQWRYAMENVLQVPPQSFDPPPRVDSAIVRMVPHAVPALLDVKLLSELVRVAFSLRRKLLRHSLGQWLTAKEFSGSFDLQRRAEEVPVAEFIALAQQMAVE